MLMTERERLAGEIKALADKLGHNRTSLIPILQEVKRKYHRIDSYAMQVIADQLGIHPVEVYSVVSFYAFLGEPAPRASSSSGSAAPSPATCRTRTGSCASWRTTWASASARPRRTASSPWNGPTAWACATRARPCW